ncbi:MAG: antibiotic biosynthesis monooxygenase family protein [Paracoccaceae bacterium]
MAVFSQTTLRVHPGQRDAALDAVRGERMFETCANAIPGFIHGSLLASRADADALCLIAEWADEASFREWLSHPLRAAQEERLAPFYADTPAFVLFDCID